METLFVYILPLVGMIGLIVFLRTCCRNKEDQPVPRAMCLCMFIATCIPVVGLIVCMVFGTTTAMSIRDGSLRLRDNRFTRYWFKS